MSTSSERSYRQIVKSTSLIGGASFVSVLIGMLRTKVLAVLLGPAGMGLFGVFDSIMTLGRTVADLGISASGVRRIAEATGTGDDAGTARAIISIRRLVWLLGVAGALGLFFLREPVAQFSFGHTRHVEAVGILSLGVLCLVASGGQMALLQGRRELLSQARVQVVGAVAGTCLSIPLVYFFGVRGVPAAMVATVATVLLASWWLARRIPLAPVTVSWRETLGESRAIIGLGFVFLASALMTAGVLYLLRIIIMNRLGEDAAGQFYAAATLSTVYVNFILQAMGADFYPRLTAVAKDNTACNRMVNEQAEVSMLLAMPGILATLTLAPIIIQVFYSGKFHDATDVLRWQIMGVLLRVASWPMGFILLAKNLGRLFLFTEIVFNLCYVGLLWVNLETYGLPGAGMAFFECLLFYWLMLLFVARRVSGFAWSPALGRLALVFAPAMVAVFASQALLARPWNLVVGLAVTLGIGLFCLRRLHRLVGNPKLDQAHAKICGWFKRPAS